jgi:sulfatase-modifying factor enzyme 1
VLLAGIHADDCTSVIRWLADAQPEVAAQCLLESGAEAADREVLYRDLHDAWLPRLTDLQRDPEPEARAAVGRALGRLGLDDRKGVGLDAHGLPDIDWVEIPGREFIYQQGERRELPAFRIARYPVTNAQFDAFVRAGGYGNERWWQGLDKRYEAPGAPSWAISNHPRETVSWFEAMAFCTWLSGKLGGDVTLPTEEQWERAARGSDGREYPWGEGYRTGCANIDETWGAVGQHRLGRTSAVGIYPQDASPEGVSDLAGNVWEWCLNEYENPRRTQRSGTESRVVRGGSWGLNQDNARAACRDRVRPGYRLVVYGGFRLVCASPIR